MGLMDCYMFNTIMKWNDRKMSDNMKTVSGNAGISGKAAKSALFALIGAAAALILDQVTKYMAVEHLMSSLHLRLSAECLNCAIWKTGARRSE